MKWKIELRGEGPVNNEGQSNPMAADAQLIRFIETMKESGHSVELVTIETPSRIGQVVPPAICDHRADPDDPKTRCGKRFVPSWGYPVHRQAHREQDTKRMKLAKARTFGQA